MDGNNRPFKKVFIINLLVYNKWYISLENYGIRICKNKITGEVKSNGANLKNAEKQVRLLRMIENKKK